MTVPTHLVQYWSGTTWASLGDIVTDVTGSVDTGAVENGFAFGSAVFNRATIKTTVAASGLSWNLLKMRVLFAYDGGAWNQGFIGVCTRRTREDNQLTFECEGLEKYIALSKIYTPLLYRRPISTETTASSIEDPDDVAYAAGLVNRIFWEAGGRPLVQSGTYPLTSGTVKFYYDCEPSTITPTWSWANGENALDELYRLARAAGGQITQGFDGTIKYVSALDFAVPSGTATYTDANYASISEQYSTYEKVGTVECAFTPRYIGGYQELYNDTQVYLLQSGESRSLAYEMQYPVYEYKTVTSGNFNTVFYDSTMAPLTVSGVDYDAQKIAFTVQNNNTQPVVISRFSVRGRPILPSDKGVVTHGSGLPVAALEDNPYIQSFSHAQKLVRMVYDFYSPMKPTITLQGVPYDTSRYLGEIIQISSAAYAISGLHRIINLSHELTGIKMSMTVVPVTDILKETDFYIVGNTYNTTDVKKVVY